MWYSGSSGEGVALLYYISRKEKAQAIEFVPKRKIFLSWIFKCLFFSPKIMQNNLKGKCCIFYLLSQRIRRHSCKELTQLTERLQFIKHSDVTTQPCENQVWHI